MYWARRPWLGPNAPMVQLCKACLPVRTSGHPPMSAKNIKLTAAIASAVS